MSTEKPPKKARFGEKPSRYADYGNFAAPDNAMELVFGGRPPA
jgi:hypothetical protein